MRIVGLFDEFWPDRLPKVGPIRSFVSDVPSHREAELCRYLRSGYELFSAMGATPDLLGSDASILGGASVLTDGEWMWRADLEFYVAENHLRLSEEFVDRVSAMDFTVPQKNLDDLRRLTLELKALRNGGN